MLACCSLALLLFGLPAQNSTGTAGVIQGVVTDPSGSAVPGATVTIAYRVTGFERATTTDLQGRFHFSGVPFNPYHLTVAAPGFQTAVQDVSVRSAIPVKISVKLTVAAEATSVEVHSDTGDLLENVPTDHTDLDRELFTKLPNRHTGSGLSDAITLGTPGVVADSNGFFHPLGEHADTSFSVDNQPITDQQSKNYSNQLPLNIFQSVEVLNGALAPEYGDKSSLVVNAITRSGMGLKRPSGSFSAQYGSFGTPGEAFSLGFGGDKWGNFVAFNVSRSGRYLDSPEFAPLHDTGNDEKFFDRVDFQPATFDTLHLNLFLARSWYQIPNTYDQQASGQDQRQLVRSLNVAPGWVHLFGATTSVTVTPYFREDRVEYYPSHNIFADLPATVSQNRRLANTGAKVDLAYVRGRHNAKIGFAFSHTALDESFSLGITDPAFNTGSNFQPGLVPYDLTRGGSPFRFRGGAGINQQAIYLQDTIALGGASIMAGLREDHYDGLSTGWSLQPRLGLSYLVKATGTVLRASYTRLFETPYNENLVLSSSTGAGGLASNAFGAFGGAPLRPGRRNQFNTGFEQAINKVLQIDGDYFWKFTRNTFDFDTLFNTPIAFPIEWRKSKVDGLALRLTLTNVHGFSAFTVMGHTRARVFGPEIGGLIFNSPLEAGVFRIDHDQAFEQTTQLRYQHGKTGPWVAFTWRYDSGMVAGSVPDMASAIALSADSQAAMGLFCGNTFATLGHPITSCASPVFGATRVRIPAPGTYNPDTNPPRIAPRHLFDVSIGTDNLFHTDRPRYTLRLSALNLTNKEALYNFLSTFSGTHFVTPRVWQAELGLVF